MNKFIAIERDLVPGRIGRKPINIPTNVSVTLRDNILELSSSLGQDTMLIPSYLTVQLSDNIISLILQKEENKAMHGTIRQLLFNKIEGLEKHFVKELEVQGVGYNFEDKNDSIFISVGFSHKVIIKKRKNLFYSVPNKNILVIQGINKQEVNNEAAQIRKIKKPNAYDGKGIRYRNEVVKLKARKKT